MARRNNNIFFLKKKREPGFFGVEQCRRIAPCLQTLTSISPRASDKRRAKAEELVFGENSPRVLLFKWQTLYLHQNNPVPCAAG